MIASHIFRLDSSHISLYMAAANFQLQLLHLVRAGVRYTRGLGRLSSRGLSLIISRPISMV